MCTNELDISKRQIKEMCRHEILFDNFMSNLLTKWLLNGRLNHRKEYSYCCLQHFMYNQGRHGRLVWGQKPIKNA